MKKMINNEKIIALEVIRLWLRNAYNSNSKSCRAPPIVCRSWLIYNRCESYNLMSVSVRAIVSEHHAFHPCNAVSWLRPFHHHEYQEDPPNLCLLCKVDIALSDSYPLLHCFNLLIKIAWMVSSPSLQYGYHVRILLRTISTQPKDAVFRTKLR